MHHHDHDHDSQRPPLSLVILAVLLLIALGIMGRVVAPQVQAQIDPSQETAEARVIEVVEEGIVDQGGVKQPYQKLRLEILTGQRAGRAVTVDYGTQSFGSSAVLYRPTIMCRSCAWRGPMAVMPSSSPNPIGGDRC